MLKFVMWLVLIVISVSPICAGGKAQFYASGVNDAVNTYIVVLKKSVEQASDMLSISARLSQNFGVKPERQIQIGKFRALIIKAERERITTLLNEEEIDYIEQDKPVKVFGNTPSNCQDYPVDEIGQWGLVRINSRNAVDMECDYDSCNYTADNAYSYGASDNGSNTYVYVFDSGVRVEHAEFGGRAEHGFVASTIAETQEDRFGHGTHVAGIAVGEKYGVAKAAKVISVKVLNGIGEGSLSGVTEGVEWAVNDVLSKKRKGICNLSLGGEGKLRVLEDAIESALSQGIPFVLSAGNGNTSACRVTPAFLGKETSVITVGATTAFDEMAYFSNYGDCVNILAPGVYITSAGIANNTEYVIKSGTSMAVPFVAGVVARLMSGEESSLTPGEIKLRIQKSATSDVISMDKYQRTPNKLLYFKCDLTTTPTTRPTTRTKTTTRPGSRPKTTSNTTPDTSGSGPASGCPIYKSRMTNIIIMLVVMVSAFQN